MHFCTLVIIEDPGTRELAYIKDEVALDYGLEFNLEKLGQATGVTNG